MSNYDDVRRFHEKFGVLVSDLPTLLPKDLFDFRAGFLKEELQEFMEAHEAGNIATAADSLVDLVYVAIGTALMMGLPWDTLWHVVQAANMQKVRAASAEDSASNTGRGHVQDVVKPKGWQHPNIGLVLTAYAALKQERALEGIMTEPSITNILARAGREALGGVPEHGFGEWAQHATAGAGNPHYLGAGIAGMNPKPVARPVGDAPGDPE